MNQYHKIQTVFKRDPETKFKTLLMGEYSTPEFEYLQSDEWIWTEKVDGTNIRVMWDGEGTVTFGGKTDRASIPADLVNVLAEMFQSSFQLGMFRDIFDGPACLYGEGYGPKIQKGGGNYADAPSFVLFDVRVGDWWLRRPDVLEVSEKLGIDAVPCVGRGTLPQLASKVSRGFRSIWGDFSAEGIVARPKVELFARYGSRIITKLKTKDFARG